jgi:tyrosyl-DNA phosphodiesterase 1
MFLPSAHACCVCVYNSPTVDYLLLDVLDPMVSKACHQAGISFKDKDKKLSNKELQSIVPNLCQLSRELFGKNYHPFYAWSPGSSHSKLLLLVYPGFLRLVITSCNLMDADTVLGDNHWYIHDMPRLATQATTELSAFEMGVLTHLKDLGTPNIFLDSIRGLYDYSAVKVHLVTSAPGVCASAKAEKHGLLRLRRVVQDLNLELTRKERADLRTEICMASIGKLSAKWLKGFSDCALGKEILRVADEDCTIPDMKLFYPSVGDVKKAHESAQEAASNIGCHTRPWDQAPDGIKKLFHHYESKDTGRLFHQKLILAYNPRDSKALPYFVYVGSANFSQSAWGLLEQDKKLNEATCNTKLVKLSNFECGVVIPGSLIEGLLEPGTENWQSGIVPYLQTGEQYDLSKDRPWNGTFGFRPNVLFSFEARSAAGTQDLGAFSTAKQNHSEMESLQLCLNNQHAHMLNSQQIRDGFRTGRRTIEARSL